MTTYPDGYYCTHCPHAVFLHNEDGSCNCGLDCGTFPKDAPTAGVTVAPQPDSPAADDGVACNWDENGYCRCKPAPALDVEALERALPTLRWDDGTREWPDGTQARSRREVAGRIAAAYAEEVKRG